MCVADIKSLGVILEVRVTSDGASVMVNGASKNLDIRHCCIFGDGERIVSFDADAPITMLPIFSRPGGVAEFKKIGVLYLRILKSRPLNIKPNKRNYHGQSSDNY